MFFNSLNGYCNVSLYFLGILGVMKLHHSETTLCSYCVCSKHSEKTTAGGGGVVGAGMV